MEPCPHITTLWSGPAPVLTLFTIDRQTNGLIDRHTRSLYILPSIHLCVHPSIHLNKVYNNKVPVLLNDLLVFICGVDDDSQAFHYLPHKLIPFNDMITHKFLGAKKNSGDMCWVIGPKLLHTLFNKHWRALPSLVSSLNHNAFLRWYIYPILFDQGQHCCDVPY